MTYDPTYGAVVLLMGTCLFVGGLLAVFVLYGLPALIALRHRGEVADAATPELAALIDDRLPRRVPDRDSDLPSRAELQRWAQVDLDTSGDWDAALRNLTGGSS